MNELLRLISKSTLYKKIEGKIKDKKVEVIGLNQTEKGLIASLISCSHAKKLIYVANDELDAMESYKYFSNIFMGKVLYLPPKEYIFYSVEAKSHENEHERIKVLSEIGKENYDILITPTRALLQKITDPDEINKNTITLANDMEISMDDFSSKLVTLGYKREEMVEGAGQFSIRGGIVDVFLVGLDNPVRIEFFGDYIDNIRAFDSSNQRTIDSMEKVSILPAKEILINDTKRDSLVNNLKELKNESGELIFEKEIEELLDSKEIKGEDRFINLLLDEKNILDYTSNKIVIIDDYDEFTASTKSIEEESRNEMIQLLEANKTHGSLLDIYIDFIKIEKKIEDDILIKYNMIPKKETDTLIYSNVKSIPAYMRDLKKLISDIEKYKEREYTIVFTVSDEKKGRDIVNLLIENNIYAVFSNDNISNNRVNVISMTLLNGFELRDDKIAVITQKMVFPKKKKEDKIFKSKNTKKIKAFSDIVKGDYVVHQTHGIGIYEGIERLDIQNVEKDYIKIQYRDESCLYIPTEQLDLIQKYIGSESRKPRIHKLGSKEWQKTKNKVRESLMDIAGELIKLYKTRQSIKGYEYPSDSEWQREFESQFEYEETEDQLNSIKEIKSDMESEVPMDRLLCGDVGYGKTEVAIRAMFKACMNTKQVAYLVPTTVLAQQQYNLFLDRFKDYPINVDVISRFRTESEQKAIIRNVKNGNTDILIGTHRLLSKDIKFKDLGLLVVDEEQRFGVLHKEKIKEKYPYVDVLTLTATPIPRTLHMSMTGIRDISVIEMPPRGRYPVQTYVMEYDDVVVKNAIYREIAREGQVFYIHNRVRDIEIKKEKLKKMFPRAKIETAHGQMGEAELEKKMEDFAQKKFDVLLCTTIVESGLDISNANTMIIEDAQNFGLAQLYQLKGRIGRSNKHAYAYITYRKDIVLNEIAKKRLKAIGEFTEFGAGFNIALRDLEIRGAGDLLGSKQHGQMDAVGYDMYCQLLEEAVSLVQGEERKNIDQEIKIDLKASAYISEEYITDLQQRIEMYKKIANIQSEEDFKDVLDELIDRFGEPDSECINLMNISYIKYMATEIGFDSIVQKTDNKVILRYERQENVNLDAIAKLGGEYKQKLLFSTSKRPYLTYISNDVYQNIVKNIKVLLQRYIKLNKV